MATVEIMIDPGKEYGDLSKYEHQISFLIDTLILGDDIEIKRRFKDKILIAGRGAKEFAEEAQIHFLSGMS